MFSGNTILSNTLQCHVKKMVLKHMKDFDPKKSHSIANGYAQSCNDREYLVKCANEKNVVRLHELLNFYSDMTYLAPHEMIDRLCTLMYYNVFNERQWQVVWPVIDAFDFSEAYSSIRDKLFDLSYETSFLENGLLHFLKEFDRTDGQGLLNREAFVTKRMKGKPLIDNIDYADSVFAAHDLIKDFLQKWPYSYQSIHKDMVRSISLVMGFFKYQYPFVEQKN